ncbi:MAG: glycogen synthase, partial [Thermoanaerobaculia bacterium]|nr:glycogen synthase [Thermoanaerobaculia bacterium]
MKICIVTSELAPLAKTGGLGDAVAGLARFLAGAGADLRLFLPAYRSGRYDARPVVPVDFLQDLVCELGPYRFGYSIDTTPLADDGPAVYLVRCPALYDREGIYDARGDEHLRYALLAKVAIEVCQRMGFGPDVFHVHDWHASLVPLYLRALFSWDRLFAASRTLVTIHNLAYQGAFPAATVDEVGLGGFRQLVHQEELAHGRFSFLTSGILYATALSAVSETYAREITTPELGFGLDGLLRARAERLVGIVNGVDYGEWSPEADPHIPHRYSPADPAPKELDKRALMAEAGLAYDPEVPVVGIVSRLTAQKGFDLLVDVAPELLARRDLRLVVLGTGESGLEGFFHRLERDFPRRVSFYCGFDNPLAHRIQAGSDLFLMPSRYEPCGLTQLYSLRYGTVPIVRRTGGLADTVEPWDPAAGRGTGIVFDHYDAAALRW